MKIFKSRLFAFILGALIFTGVGVYASEALRAQDILYSNSKDTNITSVKDALDKLYESGTGGPTYVAPQTGDTHKGVVYINPLNASDKCNASNAISITGVSGGCMKFYVFDDSGDTYKIILDHNTSALASGDNYNKRLTLDTVGWIGTPRLITSDEIKAITNATSFDGNYGTWFYFDGGTQTQTATSQGASDYAWLFNYTKNCTSNGCDTAESSTSGYWTSTRVSNDSQRLWYVENLGRLYFNSYSWHDDLYGIRPVITVSKSLFN